MWQEEWWTWMWKDGEEEVDQKKDGGWLWVMKWRVIEENGRRGHAAPTPNELGKGQEEKEDLRVSNSFKPGLTSLLLMK
jgi:hypothetical protein